MLTVGRWPTHSSLPFLGTHSFSQKRTGKSAAKSTGSVSSIGKSSRTIQILMIPIPTLELFCTLSMRRGNACSYFITTSVFVMTSIWCLVPHPNTHHHPSLQQHLIWQQEEERKPGSLSWPIRRWALSLTPTLLSISSPQRSEALGSTESLLWWRGGHRALW